MPRLARARLRLSGSGCRAWTIPGSTQTSRAPCARTSGSSPGSRHDHRRRAARDRVGEAGQQPIGHPLRVQPAHRRRRLGPDVSNLEQPGATEPSREQGAEARHRQWWRRYEHYVGAGQGDCSRCCGGGEPGVVRHAGAARAVDTARRPDPMVGDSVDRLAAEGGPFVRRRDCRPSCSYAGQRRDRLASRG